MMKKIFIGFGVFVFLLLATVIVLPFVIDIDKYRPQIVAIANENINGEVGIEKLKLSLWGQVKVVMSGLSVKDSQGTDLLKVGEAYIHLPFSSLIGGAPKLTLRVDDPVVDVKKFKDGRINLLSLIKEGERSAKKDKKEPVAPDEPSAPMDDRVMSYITQASVDVELTNANLKFHDLASELQTQVEGFNVLLTDISMSKTMHIKIWTNLSTKVGKDLSVKGPFDISGTLTPEFTGLDFQYFSTKLKLNFDNIVVDVPKTFRKEKGQAANIDIEATIGLNEILMSKLVVHFLDLNAYADASIKNLASPPEKVAFNLKADKPGADLDLALKVSSITTPDVDFRFRSQGIDLDVLFPPSPEAIEERERQKKLAEEQKKQPTSAVAEDDTPPVDVDAMLAPLRDDPFLKGLKAKVDIGIKEFKGFNVVAQNIVIKNTYSNLKASLDELSLGVFGGKIGLGASIDLAGERPRYDFSTEIVNLDLNQALVSQFETLANTLKGHLSFDLQGKGESLNADLLIRNLNAKGKFAVRQSEFATFDVSQTLHAGLVDAVKDIEKKYPQLEGKIKLGGIKDQVSRYEVIGGGFTMKSGVFTAPDFAAIAEPQKGVDIKGFTEVNLVEDKLFARWALVDTHNQTKLADVSIKEKGFQVPNLFQKGGQPIEFPVEVGCKLSEPCFKYDALPGHLLGIAQNNVELAAKGLLDAEKAKLQAKLDAEKKKLQAKADAEKKKLEAEKQKKLAELEKKKQELERKKKEEEAKVKAKAEEEAKKNLKKKLGF